jgi:hypothetical protein
VKGGPGFKFCCHVDVPPLSLLLPPDVCLCQACQLAAPHTRRAASPRQGDAAIYANIQKAMASSEINVATFTGGICS